MHLLRYDYLFINIRMIGMMTTTAKKKTMMMIFITSIIINAERQGSPFGWFDWIEFALTWQVSEQDETCRKSPKERRRKREKPKKEREIAARSVNINQVPLSSIWTCVERSSNSVARSSADHLEQVTEEGKRLLCDLTSIVLLRIQSKMPLIMIHHILLFILFYLTWLGRWCQLSSRAMAL